MKVVQDGAGRRGWRAAILSVGIGRCDWIPVPAKIVQESGDGICVGFVVVGVGEYDLRVHGWGPPGWFMICGIWLDV